MVVILHACSDYITYLGDYITCSGGHIARLRRAQPRFFITFFLVNLTFAPVVALFWQMLDIPHPFNIIYIRFQTVSCLTVVSRDRCRSLFRRGGAKNKREGAVLENRRLFGLMCYVNREMERRNSENLSSLGITGAQLQALVFVHRNALKGNKVCQKDVERELNLRASSVSVLLANLTSDGYITRNYADGNARTKFIELTKKGEELCLMNRDLMDKCDAIIQDALSEEEQESFKQLLIKIFNHING